MHQDFLGGLMRNISAGTRLALCLPVRWMHFSATPAQLALLVAFNLSVWMISHSLLAQGGTLNPTAIALYLAQIPLLLLACLAIASIVRNPSLVVLLAVALSASDLAFELVSLAMVGAQTGPVAQFIGWIGLLTWGWIVAVRAVAVCTGATWRQLLSSGGVIAGLMAFSFFLIPRTELWTAPSQAAAQSPLATEAGFHAQGELIERQLAAVEAGRPGTPELYFVGFAPDGSQDVFLREMRSVKAIVEREFKAERRSVALVSNAATLEQYPIATATNLRRTLAQLGARMNHEEDVLLLYVSSHGDQGFGLSANAPPLELAPLNPTVLARALNDAGIRWRVLVISACYSGGFIEPLKDDNTVVITSAAADRQSFGCETGNDWTYFGEAYFSLALPKTKSLTEAFTLASDAVAKRESAEKLSPPSNPQMFVGRAIAEKLRGLTP
jgi:hypothetical protein